MSRIENFFLPYFAEEISILKHVFFKNNSEIFYSNFGFQKAEINA